MGGRLGLQNLVMQYRHMYGQMQRDIAQVMEGLGQYPMAQRYAQLVSDLASGLKVGAGMLATCHLQMIQHSAVLNSSLTWLPGEVLEM